jgi:transcriptional regulator of arginine metabolism
MKNRVQRQLEVRKIVMSGNVHSQEQLLEKMKQNGFDLTQATLSRDLKALQVAKVPDPVNGYVYTVSEKAPVESPAKINRVNYLADGFKDIQFSGNMAVLKTMPGYASSIAAVIDQASPFEIIGTIAGDDTILLIQREGITKSDLIKALILIMPGLKDKI